MMTTPVGHASEIRVASSLDVANLVCRATDAFQEYTHRWSLLYAPQCRIHIF